MFETPRPYSESALWSLSRTFYEAQGQAAWNYGEVPFIVTSSVDIARAYAQIARAWLRDAVLPLASEGPVTILELGTGAGRFGFYFIKALLEMTEHDRLPSFRYVMSDVSLANLDALQARPELRPFVERGVLDFACFDLTLRQDLQLRCAEITLPKGPTLAIANYVFDSLPADAFHWDGTQMHEWLLGLKEGKPMTDIYDKRTLASERYSDPLFHTIIDAHREQRPHSFLIHAAAMRAIDHLRTLANEQLCVLIGDKGYQHPINMPATPPRLERHSGSVSSSLNFFSLARFVTGRGGVAISGPPSTSLNHALFSFGHPLEALREMMFHFEQSFTSGQPAEKAVLLRLTSTLQPLSLEIILRALQTSHSDPNVLHAFFNALLPLVRSSAELPAGHRAQLLGQLARVEANTYYTGDRTFDVSLQLGALFAELGDDISAIRCFRRSLDQGGNPGPALLGAAGVAVRLKQHPVARAMIERLRSLEVADAERASIDQAIALIESQLI